MELDFLEIFGTLVGLVYLWLEYRASIYLLDSRCRHACHLHLCILQGGTVCRLWHQYLLSDSRCLRLVFSGCGDTGKEVPAGRPANRRSLQRPPIVHTHGNVTFHWQLYLLSPLSALHGYLSNIPTVTFRGWIALPLP